MKVGISAILSMVLLAGIGHDADARGTEPDGVAEAYRHHAGESRERVVFHHMQSWKSLGGDHLAVRSRHNEYYLLTLGPACAEELRFGSSLKLSIRQHTRNTLNRFDTVEVDSIRCRIQEIRPVDHHAVAADLEQQGLSDPFIRTGRDR